ncbi:flagellar basal body-associated FliL family protein [Nitrospira moscoviensis]|uniref:Flagellar protein FliL n=1 Tax=Nitrospira moscoviensis TaxID=42253 RepID=A0A0K2GCN2_NITMO|nr:flagellar basal body-associated FliL family protein [Nitrospira moscoviensis]ALA58619.1 Flagellar basal body-associated protein FliL [Nitrospira moscoviensis]
MADAAAATADDKAPPAPAAPALPIKLLIIVVVAALVAGLGGAFVVVKMLGGKSEPAAAPEERKPEPQAKAESRGDGGGKHGAAAAPGAMFDLEPFIVNLADSPEIRYLKLTVKLEAENEAASAELSARVPQLRDTILVLLSSKDSTTIRTPQGKFQLRDEITQRVNGLLSKPGVRSAYFTDFVVQ